MSEQRRRRVREAIDAYKAGENREENFQFLFDCYSRPVQRYFSKRVFSEQERLDLNQETFQRVYQGLDGFRQEAPFEIWLFRIANNVYRRWLQKRRAEAEVVGQQGAPDVPDLEGEDIFADGLAWEDGEIVAVDDRHQPERDVLEKERLEVLRKAIDDLPKQMRRCVVLRIYHALTYKQVAEVMGISIQTVKVHLFQARRRLRQPLEPYFESVEL